jgi:hypothetical protein
MRYRRGKHVNFLEIDQLSERLNFMHLSRYQLQKVE